ncbi:MAG: SLC13 family permease [Acidobacteriota bacterium]
MTLSIAFLFALLVAMVYLFLTEKLPVELTAFAGLVVLVFTGYVDPSQAFVGFASPAVITMFSIFFISAALLQTGVADVVGQRISTLSGGKEVPLIILLMLVAGVMSAFMNNVAAAAVMLPAVSSVARHAQISPSRLFMPLSFGAILGGTTTLVGTPPNILTAEVIANQEGLEPFGLFDFTPIGLALLGAGILFMTTVGRRLLPDRLEAARGETSGLLTQAYRIEDRLTSIRVPPFSNLDGLTLRNTKLGTALDVRVVAVRREQRKILAPGPDFELQGEDQLLVDGRFEDLQKLLAVQGLVVQDADPGHLREISEQLHGMVLRLPEGSGLVGRSLRQLRFRDRFGVLVVGIRRGRDLVRQDLAGRVLRDTDELLVLGTESQLLVVGDQKGLEMTGELPIQELIQERMFVLQVPAGSSLADTTVRDSGLGELAGLTIVSIVRNGKAEMAVRGDEDIRAGDELLVAGNPTRVLDLLQLGDLQLERDVPGVRLESDSVRVLEAVVAPRSRAAGKSLRQLHFRDRYGLQVLALQRGGETLRKNLGNLALRFGDALLLHGPQPKLRELAEDDDFVILHGDAMSVRRRKKAPVALGALALMIAIVVFDLFPIHVAAFTGAVVTVLFGALRMEEAYKAIEWRAIYLVAAILPVGNAMETSGAAQLLANGVTNIAETYGPYAFIAALVMLSSLLSQGLDGAPTVVILAPVVLLTAEQLGISPYPLMMAVGLAASAAFMTPFSHKANLLVMSAGGYRSMDFVRVGTPLTVVVLILLVVLVPLLFPF